ncbi:Hypothetical predicted protein [Cloeon dipterum]|uniref:Uncharacterized protein n=1 Tax=Cloeon dipterum TaxID=197152 RepID=A0A8S1CD81_9INSE|nr:Hypothetical predicted protein [Cloeon dipterum]
MHSSRCAAPPCKLLSSEQKASRTQLPQFKKLTVHTLMAVALSILPSQHCYPPQKWDLSSFEKIVTWFKKKITVILWKSR